MAELPARIKVGPLVYDVVPDEALVRAREHAKSMVIWGSTDHTQLRIIIDPKASPGRQRVTLWHEVKHAVTELVNLDVGEHPDEAFIVAAAPLELAVLRDNPSLVAYLLAVDDA